MPLTLGHAKELLLTKKGWRGREDSELLAYINEASELLVMLHGKDSLDRVAITAYNEMFTLPRQWASCVGLLRSKAPMIVRNGWFEFVGQGPGDLLSADVHLWGETVDMGDKFACAREPNTIDAAGCLLRLETDANDTTENASSQFEIFGEDSSGNPIRTTPTSSTIRYGELVTLDGAVGTITTGESFATLSQVIKPVTKGIISVYAIDPTDSSETLISTWEPNETLPQYRRYKVPPAPDGSSSYTVTAWCRRRYVPLVDDSDKLVIDNFAALLHMMNYIVYRDENDDERSSRAYNEAERILTKQSLHFRPANTYPPMGIQLDEMETTYQGY